MKKIITVLSLVFTLGVLTSSAQCCSNLQANANNTKTVEVKSNDVSAIQAYYFHATRRCATCQAVEAVTKAFPGQTQNKLMRNRFVLKQIQLLP